MFFAFLLFLLSILIIGITTIPFFISVFTVSAVIFKKSWIFLVAFFMGILLDLYELRPLGLTSLVLIFFIFTIWLYERKFEIQTATFVFFASFFGSIIYLLIFKYDSILFQSIVVSLISIVLFKLIKKPTTDSVGEL